MLLCVCVETNTTNSEMELVQFIFFFLMLVMNSSNLQCRTNTAVSVYRLCGSLWLDTTTKVLSFSTEEFRCGSNLYLLTYDFSASLHYRILLCPVASSFFTPTGGTLEISDTVLSALCCDYPLLACVDTAGDKCGTAWHACNHRVHCMLDTVLCFCYTFNPFFHFLK